MAGNGPAPKAAVEARPASTVVLLRDSSDGLETLLLKRNKALLFAGGAWVFPGGALEPADWQAAGDDVEGAARQAAAREAAEETGLCPAPQSMIQISHWTTPLSEGKRFSTWIYAAPCPENCDVVIDGSEIHEARWISVQAALQQHHDGTLAVLPPTYITLCDIARYPTVAALLASGESRQPPQVFPRPARHEGQVLVMFRGDSGYESGDGSLPGPRHRAVLEGSRWRYIHDGVAAEFPPLTGA
ncbi:NUDIX domain-containing protein [Kineobactrum salinum]|uniref:NUDIX domain-containing protein n=1 Tax=Kineobactrum salinum TaxID=2708301 RepID=A0A6C0U824_9GAMM|nr:NUDIX domain-containing protein [Kineobactrum salinum]